MLKKYGILIVGVVVAFLGLIMSILAGMDMVPTWLGLACAIVGIALSIGGYVYQRRA